MIATIYTAKGLIAPYINEMPAQFDFVWKGL